MMQTPDCLSETTLVSFFGGGLPVERLLQVEAHLDVCPTCTALVEVAAPTLAGGTSGRPLVWGLPPQAEPGALIAERYRVDSVIGCGASGYVLRARDELAGVPVAVKLLRPDRATEPLMLQQLTRELRVARALNHPHVCRVFDLQISGESRFLVMELARCSLWDELRSRGGDDPLAPARFDDAEAITAGLAAIHAAGILHRDVKPANVLRLDDGRLVVSDFGLASLAPQGSATRFVGTPLYMAPEVAAGEQATRASDLFSLGLVLHELFFGCRPRWQINGGRRVFEMPPGLRGGRQRALARLCAGCLALSPSERPRDVAAVARRLRTIRARRVFPWTGMMTPGRPALLAGLASLALLALGVGRLMAPANLGRPMTVQPKSTPPLTTGDWVGVEDWLVSGIPRSPVPIPTLPRTHKVRDRLGLGRVGRDVERAAISAGVSTEYALGITDALQRQIMSGDEIYPVAMYYIIVREAALRHDRVSAAANLADAQTNGLMLKLRNLPAIERVERKRPTRPPGTVSK
jgi:serine/threonine protein kinase